MYAIINISGIAALVSSGFFGYMLALLVRRVKDMFSSHDVSFTITCLLSSIASCPSPIILVPMLGVNFFH